MVALVVRADDVQVPVGFQIRHHDVVRTAIGKELLAPG